MVLIMINIISNTLTIQFNALSQDLVLQMEELALSLSMDKVSKSMLDLFAD